jgi:two-component system, LytTR family, response regulator
MLTCIIIDDEQHCIDWLQSLIEKSKLLEIKATFINPTEALFYLNTNPVDVVFTDIQMPELSGIDLLQALHTKMHFVVSSAFPQFAIEGFTYDVLDYLLKPVTLVRFSKTLQKITECFASKQLIKETTVPNDYIFVKTEAKGKLTKINFADITLIENKANYVGIHIGKTCILSLQNMKDIIKLLPANQFMRIHNSFIAPIKGIHQIEGNCLHIIGVDFNVPIGVTYKEVVTKQLGLVTKT